MRTEKKKSRKIKDADKNHVFLRRRCRRRFTTSNLDILFKNNKKTTQIKTVL